MSALHVAFTKPLSSAIRAEAARRGLRPHVMVAAAIRLAVEHDLLDAIFDGLDPHGVAGGHARRINGLTHRRCAVICMMARHADADGYCRLSTHGYAQLIGGSRASAIGETLHWLWLNDIAERAALKGHRGLLIYRLTRAGREIAQELLGTINATG